MNYGKLLSAQKGHITFLALLEQVNTCIGTSLIAETSMEE